MERKGDADAVLLAAQAAAAATRGRYAAGNKATRNVRNASAISKRSFRSKSRGAPDARGSAVARAGAAGSRAREAEGAREEEGCIWKQVETVQNLAVIAEMRRFGTGGLALGVGAGKKQLTLHNSRATRIRFWARAPKRGLQRIFPRFFFTNR